MIFFLIVTFLLIILNIFILGFIFSKVSVNIENCNIFSNSVFENINIDKMQIFINLYIFKVIKIISIKFYKKYFKIGFVKIYYYQIKKYEKKIIQGTFKLTKLLLGKNKLTLSILNPKIEMFNMNLSICSKNAALTSIYSSLIGTSTSILLSKFVKKYDKNKIFYKIVPVYFNINGFKLEIKSKINFNTLNILEFLYDYYLIRNNNWNIGKNRIKFWKGEVLYYDRTSNRRSYGNSYE